MDERIARARERIDSLTVAISVRALPQIVGQLMDTRLTVQQLKVLTAVVVDDGRTTGTLAADFGVSMATMSKLVDRLAAQHLVERVVDAGDQRVRRILATALGRDVAREVLATRPELGADVIAGLDADELEALEKGLRAVNRELHRLSRPDASS